MMDAVQLTQQRLREVIQSVGVSQLKRFTLHLCKLQAQRNGSSSQVCLLCCGLWSMSEMNKLCPSLVGGGTRLHSDPFWVTELKVKKQNIENIILCHMQEHKLNIKMQFNSKLFGSYFCIETLAQLAFNLIAHILFGLLLLRVFCCFDAPWESLLLTTSSHWLSLNASSLPFFSSSWRLRI